MKRTMFLLVALATFVCGQIKAQSIERAEEYYRMGEYLQAAKILRPLADGGDARAQVLAADMFFAGKGVPKNEAQGIKYARMAANQGYEDGIVCLALHYYEAKNYTKFYETSKEFASKHPYLMKDKVGCYLGICYLKGWGVAKDEDKGWEIITESSWLENCQKDYPDSWEAYKKRHPELFKVHNTVEQMPSFPGGPSALMAFLSKEINYPAIAINRKIQGRVVVSFVVERNGSISSVEVVISIHPLLDEEAKRVVLSMPKWIPGKQNGKTVRTKYTIPVTFRL